MQCGCEEKRLEIRFEGKRFDGHTIPLRLVDDLKTVNEMILDVACSIYKERNGTGRVPRRFREEYGFSLKGVGRGSAVAELTPAYSPQMRLSRTEEDECIDLAVSEVVGRMDGKESGHDGLILPRFKTLGSALKDDESMRFTYGGVTAVYNTETRRKLIDSIESIEIHETVYGRITEVDAKRNSFKLSAVPEMTAKRIDFDAGVLPDDSGLRIGSMMEARIVVDGTFEERSDGSKRCKSVVSIEKLEPLNVEYRLLELASLGEGWGEYGDELPPDRGSIDRLMDLYDEFGTSLRDPYIYPTADGNLELEWRSAELLSMDLDLRTMCGTLYAGDEEIDIDLNGSDGWECLIEKVGGNASG